MARTVEFNRDDVLQNAMNTFWKKGYSMTSIPNLVSATKLNPGSIYAAFHSKEGLFIETLDFYGKRSLSTLQQFIQNAESPLNGIEDFFYALINKTDEENCQGCLVVNTLLEMSSHNPKIQAQANKQIIAIETELLNVLEVAQKQGELSKDANSEALAKYLMVNIWGLRVMAKSGYLNNDDSVSKETIVDEILSNLYSS